MSADSKVGTPSSKSLVLYNTLSRKKEVFEPLKSGEVRIYLCGPTVYDFLHVGNFRGPIFYNFMRNWLEELGYKVTFVQNYTDVDDKIIVRAREEGSTPEAVAERYTQEYQKDFVRLGLRSHDLNPKVTESIPEIQSMIEDLVKKGVAYPAAGDVNFSIKAFDSYGKLSNRKPEDLLEGVRVQVGDAKRDPLDFALWKGSKEGEPSWPSPWGPGRPGWHIECSAMIRKHLGSSIDIHGGGMDLIFPHHENEIAQSEACTGHSLAKYWVHYNLINFGGAKMSKSVGNVVKGRQFMDDYGPEVLKYMVLSVHYRSTLDLSEDSIHHALSGLARIYSALAVADHVLRGDSPTDEKSPLVDAAEKAWAEACRSFNEDLNSAEAIARLFEVVRQFNGLVKRGAKVTPLMRGHAKALKGLVQKYSKLLAIFGEPAAEFLKDLDDHLLKKMKVERSQVDLLINERAQARAQKDFAKSDQIRDQLQKLGISVADTPEGVFWEVAK